MERMENLFEQKSSSTAYKAQAQTLLEELKNFSTPTQHTRLMIFMRALIFSSDTTTQSATANMLKVYLATRNTELPALQEYVARHGSPPHITGIEEVVTISGSPGMTRLSAVDNPKYFELCLRNMFDMIVECNSRICVAGLDTTAAAAAYMSTKAGNCFAETRTVEERAWAQLCRVHGNAQPKTDYDRIEFMLSLCAAYQGHTKTKRTLLKTLHKKGTTITNVPFSVALPIIGSAAFFEDEINVQMGDDSSPVAKAVAANAVGADAAQRQRNDKTMGAGAGALKCNICAKPGHNARDCLQFMQREGTCGHWFMHSIGKYKTGCTYGSACKKKHERPSFEPPENAGKATPVATMATATLPQTNGGKQVHQEMQVGDVKDRNFVIMPNETENWVKSSQIWLQPEDEGDSLCTKCDATHSQIVPCADRSCHSMLLHEMASAMAVSAVESGRPFQWMAYKTQQQFATDVNSNAVLVTATRDRAPPIYKSRPATRAQAAQMETRICYNVNAKKLDENLYDND